MRSARAKIYMHNRVLLCSEFMLKVIFTVRNQVKPSSHEIKVFRVTGDECFCCSGIVKIHHGSSSSYLFDA